MNARILVRYLVLVSLVLAISSCQSATPPPTSRPTPKPIPSLAARPAAKPGVAPKPSCEEALRVNREIAPAMRLYIQTWNMSDGPEKTKLMHEWIMSGAAGRFIDEFCPALIDCGSLPGYDQSATDTLIALCKQVMKK